MSETQLDLINRLARHFIFSDVSMSKAFSEVLNIPWNEIDNLGEDIIKDEESLVDAIYENLESQNYE